MLFIFFLFFWLNCIYFTFTFKTAVLLAIWSLLVIYLTQTLIGDQYSKTVNNRTTCVIEYNWVILQSKNTFNCTTLYVFCRLKQLSLFYFIQTFLCIWRRVYYKITERLPHSILSYIRRFIIFWRIFFYKNDFPDLTNKIERYLLLLRTRL